MWDLARHCIQDGHGNLRAPPVLIASGHKALLRDYYGVMVVDKPLKKGKKSPSFVGGIGIERDVMQFLCSFKVYLFWVTLKCSCFNCWHLLILELEFFGQDVSFLVFLLCSVAVSTREHESKWLLSQNPSKSQDSTSKKKFRIHQVFSNETNRFWKSYFLDINHNCLVVVSKSVYSHSSIGLKPPTSLGGV